MKFFILTSLSILSQIVLSQSEVSIENMPFNSEKSEYSPQPDRSGNLVFVSNKRTNNVVRRYDKDNESFFHDLYIIEQNISDKEAKPRVMNKSFGTKFHEGPFFIDYDRNVIYYTASNVVNGKKVKSSNGKVKLQLFRANIDGGEPFSVVEKVEFCDKDFSYGHPTLNKEGTLMIFSSDMEGGFGGADLYYSKFENNQWSAPINLGSSVNTEGSELYPSLSGNSTLYYSSNGSKSMGGLDIFKSEYSEIGKLFSSKRLEKPINSIADDFSFVTDVNSDDSGYLTSNRAGGKGEDDIYHWVLPKNTFLMNGIVKNDSGKGVAGVKINVTGGNKETKSTVTNQDGEFQLDLDRESENYEIAVEAKDFFPTSFIVEDFEKDKFNFEIEGLPYLTGSVIDSKTKKPIEGVEIALYDNLLKVSNSFDTRDNGEIYAPIQGHNKGEKIDYKITIRKEGYLNTSIRYKDILDHGGAFEVFMDPVEIYEIEKGLDIGKVLQLNPIYYEYNKSEITEEAKVELDKIVEALKENPSLTIELGSHSDARGSDSYNKELSDKRAKAAAKYVNDRINELGRIYGTGYGEEQLIHKCNASCSEAEHAENRRTEFKIIKY